MKLIDAGVLLSKDPMRLPYADVNLICPSQWLGWMSALERGTKRHRLHCSNRKYSRNKSVVTETVKFVRDCAGTDNEETVEGRKQSPIVIWF